MKVLLDRHHAGLYHSMQLLGDKLGWDIYTPVGREWWDEGYWNFGRWTWPDDRLAQQYLSLDPWMQVSGDIYWMKDNEFPDRWLHGVTLAEAHSIHASANDGWDIVCATLQDNQQGFAKFAREVGAQFVYQVGNTGQQTDWGLDPLVLMSSEMPIHGRGIRYHQPMDPHPFSEPAEIRSSASFVNCMPSMGACWDLLQAASFPVAVHGIDGPAGVVKPLSRSLEIMGSVGWGWHDKAHGDGFGHVIHGWAAVGRPLIGHASHYRGRMAEGLWVDGETCIDLDRHSIGEAVETVLSISPKRHREMCYAIRAKFDAIDWDGEAAAIADFLGTKLAVAA